ncbi:MAG: SufE family protein [Proteobacteria bacterium]|jgi:cysteine desulfuration protein SufE|nr:SufE family protein [Pseudomonadota bacterium]
MTIEQLIENFDLFDSWEDRYQYLIDLGKNLPALPKNLKTDEYKVRGCTSQVWFVPNEEEIKKGRISFEGESDAFIVSGLIEILKIVYNNKSVIDAKQINVEDIFKKLGLEGHLSPTRRNGFFSMVQRIQSWIQ